MVAEDDEHCYKMEMKKSSSRPRRRRWWISGYGRLRWRGSGGRSWRRLGAAGRRQADAVRRVMLELTALGVLCWGRGVCCAVLGLRCGAVLWWWGHFFLVEWRLMIPSVAT